jgi:hypothetical protein
MAGDQGELTFMRCPSCRSLVPSASAKCRMCGYVFEASKDDSSDDSSSVSSGRVRQRTVSKSREEILTALGKGSVSPTTKHVETEPLDLGPSIQLKNLEKSSNVESEGSYPSETDVENESKVYDSEDDSDKDASDEESDKYNEEINEVTESDNSLLDEDDSNSLTDDNEQIEENVLSEFHETEESIEKTINETVSVTFKEKPEDVLEEDFDDNEDFEVDNSTKPAVLESQQSEVPEYVSDVTNTEVITESYVNLPEQPTFKLRGNGSRYTIEESSVTKATLDKNNDQDGSAREELEVKSEKKDKENKVIFSPVQNKGGVSSVNTEIDQLVGWLVSFDEPRGRAIEIRGNAFFISRQRIRETDLIIDHDGVMTPHCLVTIKGASVTLQDMLSHRLFARKKGQVQYSRVEDKVEVETGDYIRFGDSEFLLVLLPLEVIAR